MPTYQSPIAAPAKGVVGEFRLASGSNVKVGDIIVTLHAAKTETNIVSPASGILKVLVEKGAQVNQGDTIAEIST